MHKQRPSTLNIPDDQFCGLGYCSYDATSSCDYSHSGSFAVSSFNSINDCFGSPISASTASSSPFGAISLASCLSDCPGPSFSLPGPAQAPSSNVKSSAKTELPLLLRNLKLPLTRIAAPPPPCQQASMSQSTQHQSRPRAHGGPPKRKKPSKVCQHPGGCPRYSQGGTRFCISHGGGKRCSYAGCMKSVQGSRVKLCIAHGGGKRCDVAGCEHAARGATNYCVAHGGGARCQELGCHKSAQRPSDFCIAHGGGRRCSVTGCLAILRGGTNSKLCQRHASVEPVLSRMGMVGGCATVKTVCNQPSDQWSSNLTGTFKTF